MEPAAMIDAELVRCRLELEDLLRLGTRRRLSRRGDNDPQKENPNPLLRKWKSNTAEYRRKQNELNILHQANAATDVKKGREINAELRNLLHEIRDLEKTLTTSIDDFIVFNP
jgi:hypothetical protein